MGFLGSLISGLGLNNQSQAQAEQQKRLAAYSQFPPQILDNYYATSRMDNILKETGVYATRESLARRQCLCNHYFFVDTDWYQIFEFTPSGNLGRIVLLHDWDSDLYEDACETLSQTCSMILASNGEDYAYFNDFASADEWTTAVSELEYYGLHKSEFHLVFADNWICDYTIAKNCVAKDFNGFIQNLPPNGRLITVNVGDEGMETDQGIAIYFDSAAKLKNA